MRAVADQLLAIAGWTSWVPHQLQLVNRQPPSVNRQQLHAQTLPCQPPSDKVPHGSPLYGCSEMTSVHFERAAVKLTGLQRCNSDCLFWQIRISGLRASQPPHQFPKRGAQGADRPNGAPGWPYRCSGSPCPFRRCHHSPWSLT